MHFNCLSHNGTWCQMTWWPSSFYFLIIIFDCYWKDEWKLEPAVVKRCLCTEFYRLSIWSESALRWHSVWKSQYWWSMFFLNTVDHACTLLEYVKVLSRGKWSKNCTASLWKLWLGKDFVLVIPVWKQPGAKLTELMCYLKENSPQWSHHIVNLFHSTINSLPKDTRKN